MGVRSQESQWNNIVKICNLVKHLQSGVLDIGNDSRWPCSRDPSFRILATQASLDAGQSKKDIVFQKKMAGENIGELMANHQSSLPQIYTLINICI